MKRPVGVEKVTQRVCHAHGHGMGGSVCETSRSWIAGGGGRSARSVAAICPRTFSEGHFLRDGASRRPRYCFSQPCLGGRLGPTGRRTARPWYSGFGLQRPILGQQLYGDVTLRQFRDLDILVAPADALRTRDALCQLGYQETSRSALPCSGSILLPNVNGRWREQTPAQRSNCTGHFFRATLRSTFPWRSLAKQ